MKKIHVGENDTYSLTTSKLNNRFPEYSMTNDPEKVWPGALVHYLMDISLSKLLTMYTCSIHACANTNHANTSVNSL